MNNKPLFYKRLITAVAIVSSIAIYFLTKDYMNGLLENWNTLDASIDGESSTAVVNAAPSALAGLLIMTILSIIMLVVTIVAWNNRRIGGWLFIVLAIIGAALAFFQFQKVALLSSAVIVGVLGVLFFWHYWKYPKKRRRRM